MSVLEEGGAVDEENEEVPDNEEMVFEIEGKVWGKANTYLISFTSNAEKSTFFPLLISNSIVVFSPFSWLSILASCFFRKFIIVHNSL
ncbi:MAG: hypothetical protein BWY04_00415 [candidate division CPR1 bacterium ADurb.Bin160]|jgi:hypothetical protein|uniref:Uncharacterized protein n=1 Tax=candidate division CPR1 bacterium ADurb.Bin160 TaxID=1852826 RepID=A0A1V5ZQW0_9BACT|nr:MAG: hypothetical protein BWY04_00415 [candidate division CPR1 bacterium ADurb.Bin160]